MKRRERCDLLHDRAELRNIASTPANAAMEAGLGRQRSAWMTADDDHFDRSQPSDRFGRVQGIAH